MNRFGVPELLPKNLRLGLGVESREERPLRYVILALQFQELTPTFHVNVVLASSHQDSEIE